VALISIVLLSLGMGLASKTTAPAVMEPVQGPIRGALAPLSHSPLEAVKRHELASLVASGANDDVEQRALGVRIVCWVYGFGAIVSVVNWVAGCFRIRRVADEAFSQTDLGVLFAWVAGYFWSLILLPKERVLAAVLHERAHIGRQGLGVANGPLLAERASVVQPCSLAFDFGDAGDR
jgi:hypothetical protein